MDRRRRCSPLLPWCLGVLALVLVFAPSGTHAEAATADPEPPAARPATDEYLLHMPGITGYHWIDQQFLAGLRAGGFAGDLDVRDWPGADPGLAALFAHKRNLAEAQAVADAVVARAREHPGGRIILTGHSGGAGIAVWALERLPADVKVDTVLLLAPALSPDYDLTAALAHVRGNVYAFTSTLDAIVLGAGTTTFGTIDGKKVDAAGRTGFVAPESADRNAYQKLVQLPYEAKWMREGNIGDHIGPMGWRFARNVVTPLLTGKDAPPMPPPVRPRGNTSTAPAAGAKSAAPAAAASPP